MYQKKSVNNAFHVKHALKIVIHQLRICKQKTKKISPFEAHFGCKPNAPLSVISTKPKMSNLTYENIVNYYLGEDTVTPEAILLDHKWLNWYRSDIEVELGMTRAAQEANDQEQAIADGESRFIRSGACQPVPITERAVQLKLVCKIHGKRRSEKNLEGLNEVFAPGSNILKVSPTTSTMKEPGKAIITVRKSELPNFWRYKNDKPH